MKRNLFLGLLLVALILTSITVVLPAAAQQDEVGPCFQRFESLATAIREGDQDRIASSREAYEQCIQQAAEMSPGVEVALTVITTNQSLLVGQCDEDPQSCQTAIIALEAALNQAEAGEVLTVGNGPQVIPLEQPFRLEFGGEFVWRFHDIGRGFFSMEILDTGEWNSNLTGEHVHEFERFRAPNIGPDGTVHVEILPE